MYFDKEIQNMVIHVLCECCFHKFLPLKCLSLNILACAGENQQFGFRPCPTQTSLYSHRSRPEQKLEISDLRRGGIVLSV